MHPSMDADLGLLNICLVKLTSDSGLSQIRTQYNFKPLTKHITNSPNIIFLKLSLLLLIVIIYNTF